MKHAQKQQSTCIVSGNASSGRKFYYAINESKEMQFYHVKKKAEGQSAPLKPLELRNYIRMAMTEAHSDAVDARNKDRVFDFLRGRKSR